MHVQYVNICLPGILDPKYPCLFIQDFFGVGGEEFVGCSMRLYKFVLRRDYTNLKFSGGGGEN